MSLLTENPSVVARALRERGVRRFYLVTDKHTGKVTASDPSLQELADWMGNDPRDFRNHEGFFAEVHPTMDVLLGATVHKTNRGQAAGGVRFWYYDSMEQYLRDGLRLACGMTRKNALAGLWWGGGKGVITQPADGCDLESRRRLFTAYGDFMTSLQGCYVTAEDVGVSTEDVAAVFSRSRFATCIPPELGGSGNPSPPTARGVLAAIEAGLATLGMGPLDGKRVVVQGMGHVGLPLISELLQRGVKRVTGSDISDAMVSQAVTEINDERLVGVVNPIGDNSVLAQDCDIVAPCAVGAILNAKTIPDIRAKIVCGAANNQLEDEERDAQLIHDRGIAYIPDFLANRMGIVTCANEQYGFVTPDRAIERHFDAAWEHSIPVRTAEVLTESRKTGRTTAEVAMGIADRLAEQEHPLFGHRGQEIIDGLVRDKWHTKG